MLDVRELEGVYIVKELNSPKVEVVSAARVFTEPWVAQREAKLVQAESNKCYSAKAMSQDIPLIGRGGPPRVATEKRV